ncbi:MAG: glycosyltransferase family 4 protein, partial [Pseudomonadota bacterium]|nr:glycosyltransferase family 4 protein [Pseudomonadota bacterium]
CVAWEHGDPTPAFFDHDRAERQRVKNVKQKHIYPNVDAVVAISRFVAADIDWPAATVIANGIDHVDAKPDPTPVTAAPAPLRVGTLMRLGQGEAYYKGNDLFLDLVAAAEAAGVNARFEVMGRGEDADAARFRARGLTVHLNASDAARDRYLHDLDVFVSCSRWEGFNLPLLEAQAQGTPALAFDVGAHPETTPLLMASLAEMLAQIAAYDRDRTLVRVHGRMARRFAGRFTWRAAADDVRALIAQLPADPSQRPRYQSPMMVRLRSRWQLVLHYSEVLRQSLGQHGVGGTLARVQRRLFGGRRG